MPDIWIISDTHFGHDNCLTWCDRKGRRIRPFDSITEHDELIRHNWRKMVKQTDKIYHLGDVAMNIKHAGMIADLPGRKRLILGNHDRYERRHIKKMCESFQQIASNKTLTVGGYNIVLTHIPIYMDRWYANFHGHLHDEPSPTPRHVNCCLEHTDWGPVHVEELLARAKAQRKAAIKRGLDDVFGNSDDKKC